MLTLTSKRTWSSGKTNLIRIFLCCGILSSLLYVLMNIFVAMQYEGYDSASQTVSEISAIDAPTRPLWVLLGFFYTLLVTVFGWGVLQSAKGNRNIRIVGILMFIYGIIGIAWAFAPMHQRTVIANGGGTISDTLHIAMSMVTVVLMLLAMGFSAAAFGKKFRWYAIVTIVLLLVLGLLTALDAPKLEKNLPTPWLGIWERIMIGVFLIWVMVVSMILLKKKKED